jgi:pyridoxal phosphate enzyme (YggS family)
VETFDWIHSVDREELAAKLDHYSTKPLPILAEVKLQDEPSKSGIAERDLASLIRSLERYSRLNLRGLMAVPPFSPNPEESRPYFRKLCDLGKQFGLQELSMGMSSDFEVAIEEGATMVRVGTALFGARRL